MTEPRSGGSRRKDDPRCSNCGDSGFALRTREDGTIASVRCACDANNLGERRLKAARIPRRYDHCTLDSFECHDPSQARACDVVRDWVDLWPAVDHGLFFVGSPGTGKTHLSVSIAKELLTQKGAQVLFYEQRDLLKSLQGTFDTSSMISESEVLAPVLESEVLILDDLGAGRITPWARDVMHDLIAHRYNEKRVMIITSNHGTGDEKELSAKSRSYDSPVTLRDRLGGALMSRIYEMCRIVKVQGGQGRDYRRDILNARIPR